jgi:prevent-host-death family protein
VITVSVTEFKAHCLRLMEEAHLSGETIEVVKRGRPFATVVPRSPEGSYKPGAFKNVVRIVGEIQVDGADLGVRWEAES